METRGLSSEREARLLCGDGSALQNAGFLSAPVVFPAARKGLAFRSVFTLSGGFPSGFLWV